MILEDGQTLAEYKVMSNATLLGVFVELVEEKPKKF
jgi:hypothetical protein